MLQVLQEISQSIESNIFYSHSNSKNMSKIKTTELPEDNCPKCDKSVTRATSTEGEIPEKGDITICINCRTWLKFSDEMRLIILTEKEIKALPNKIYEKLVMTTLALELSRPPFKNR
jgi:hypothetical protein